MRADVDNLNCRGFRRYVFYHSCGNDVRTIRLERAALDSTRCGKVCFAGCQREIGLV